MAVPFRSITDFLPVKTRLFLDTRGTTRASVYFRIDPDRIPTPKPLSNFELTASLKQIPMPVAEKSAQWVFFQVEKETVELALKAPIVYTFLHTSETTSLKHLLTTNIGHSVEISGYPEQPNNQSPKVDTYTGILLMYDLDASPTVANVELVIDSKVVLLAQFRVVSLKILDNSILPHDTSNPSEASAILRTTLAYDPAYDLRKLFILSTFETLGYSAEIKHAVRLNHVTQTSLGTLVVPGSLPSVEKNQLDWLFGAVRATLDSTLAVRNNNTTTIGKVSLVFSEYQDTPIVSSVSYAKPKHAKGRANKREESGSSDERAAPMALMAAQPASLDTTSGLAHTQTLVDDDSAIIFAQTTTLVQFRSGQLLSPRQENGALRFLMSVYGRAFVNGFDGMNATGAWNSIVLNRILRVHPEALYHNQFSGPAEISRTGDNIGTFRIDAWNSANRGTVYTLGVYNDMSVAMRIVERSVATDEANNLKTFVIEVRITNQTPNENQPVYALLKLTAGYHGFNLVPRGGPNRSTGFFEVSIVDNDLVEDDGIVNNAIKSILIRGADNSRNKTETFVYDVTVKY